MTRLDYIILLIAACTALLAAVLWVTQDDSIALEEAPLVAQQLVAESGDPEIQAALADGREIRLRKVKPAESMPSFHRVAPEAAPSEEAEAAATEMPWRQADDDLDAVLAQGSGSSGSSRTSRTEADAARAAATARRSAATASAAADDAAGAAAQAAAEARR